jgi:hypothetical protein
MGRRSGDRIRCASGWQRRGKPPCLPSKSGVLRQMRLRLWGDRWVAAVDGDRWGDRWVAAVDGDRWVAVDGDRFIAAV